MSTAASENRPLAAPTASAVWPVLFLVAIAGGCWAVTVERMQGMDMGPGTDLGGLGWFAVVWVTMMAAMMLPSLSPMAVACSRSAGRGRPARSPEPSFRRRVPAALGRVRRARVRAAPLRLRGTSFDSRPRIAGRHAHGYERDRKQVVDVSVLSPSFSWAAGAIVSTADDLANFYRALLRGRLLRLDLLQTMQATVAARARRPWRSGGTRQPSAYSRPLTAANSRTPAEARVVVPFQVISAQTSVSAA
jgi:hypothetical protein